MGTKVAIHHVTKYNYDRAVNLGPQLIRLKPAAHCRTPILSYSLNLQPQNHFLNWLQDPFGNYLARAVFPDSTKIFQVEVDLIAEIQVYNPFDFFIEEYAKTSPFSYEPELKKELEPYLEISESGPHLLELCETLRRKKRLQLTILWRSIAT